MYTYLALLLMVPLSLIPPINFFITNPQNDKWFIMVLIAGFLGIYTLFIKTNYIVRIIAIGTFISCFFSSAPFISFTSYVSTVACCYFYIICTKIENWKVIYRAFTCLLLLNVLLIFMQALGRDQLLNFGLGHGFHCFGAVGHHMQMGSFSVILSAMLLPFGAMSVLPPFLIAVICQSTWTLFSAGVGVFIILFFKNKNTASIFAVAFMFIFLLWGIKEGKFTSNAADSGRLTVWKRTIELANQKPLTGWGPGTYKLVFPPLSKLTCIPYKTAHNWVVQLVFELGYPFTIFILLCLARLVYTLYRTRQVLCLAGLCMILCDMLVHFPERMIQCVLIIICFLAYCKTKTPPKNTSGVRASSTT